jgi:hypothetical protein
MEGAIRGRSTSAMKQIYIFGARSTFRQQPSRFGEQFKENTNTQRKSTLPTPNPKRRKLLLDITPPYSPISSQTISRKTGDTNATKTQCQEIKKVDNPKVKVKEVIIQTLTGAGADLLPDVFYDYVELLTDLQIPDDQEEDDLTYNVLE